MPTDRQAGRQAGRQTDRVQALGVRGLELYSFLVELLNETRRVIPSSSEFAKRVPGRVPNGT